jgi:hypothetical protein
MPAPVGYGTTKQPGLHAPEQSGSRRKTLFFETAHSAREHLLQLDRIGVHVADHALVVPLVLGIQPQPNASKWRPSGGRRPTP